MTRRKITADRLTTEQIRGLELEAQRTLDMDLLFMCHTARTAPPRSRRRLYARERLATILEGRRPRYTARNRRPSISINGDVYRKLETAAAGRSVSGFIEDRINAFLDRLGVS